MKAHTAEYTVSIWTFKANKSCKSRNGDTLFNYHFVYNAAYAGCFWYAVRRCHAMNYFIKCENVAPTSVRLMSEVVGIPIL